MAGVAARAPRHDRGDVIHLRRAGLATLSALTAVALSAGTASASPDPVRLAGRTVSTPSGHGLHHRRTLVTALSGVAAAPAQRITAAINATTSAVLAKPWGDLADAAEVDDAVTLVRADSLYVTVAQSVYEYYYLGAHGDSAIVPLTFDRSTGALLTLHSFVVQGHEKALLHALSVATRSALHRRGVDPAAYSIGTEATYQDFAAFEPLSSGLLVEFAQGAVDYEAAGPLTVLVHWPTLNGLVGLPLPQA